MSITIHCPSCGRALGDTEQSLDATINCKKCGAQKIRLTIADHNDYLKATSRKEQNDKS